MIRRPAFVLLLLALLLAACDSREGPRTGPLLVGEVTLPPATDLLPTRYLSPTPVPVGITPEQVSPLEQITVEADFVIVTPTLPPSKTPTLTPTQSATPTLTRTPTVTVTATATAPFFPTSVIVPVTQVVANPVPLVCDSTWFFIQPAPPSCPLHAPLAQQAVYQRFENGHMIWLGAQDAIYVLYDDFLQPRWQIFRDYFVEGEAEADPAFEPNQPGVWQPRRGFGLLWRTSEAVRTRIGRATQQWEQPYSAQVQTGSDGSVFISDTTNGIFALLPRGLNWQRFTTSFFSGSP